jgi:leucyl/phenylalanyl-tRNA--protein transferase
MDLACYTAGIYSIASIGLCPQRGSLAGWRTGGGLYGIRLGKIFFGESMFSEVSNASKFAFITYVQQLRQDDLALIDCQVYTAHLEQFGARMIERRKFLEILKENI